MTAAKKSSRRTPRTSSPDLYRELLTLPNVGPATAEDLLRLGVRSVKDLRSRDPFAMYRRLAQLDGVPHDPCVLDVLMAVVDYANTGKPKPWWHFTARRKQAMAALQQPRQASPRKPPSRKHPTS